MVTQGQELENAANLFRFRNDDKPRFNENQAGNMIPEFGAQMARDEGYEAKVVLSVARNDVWTAHSLVKNMVMHGFVSWLMLSREYDSMRGVDRTLAYNEA